MKYQIISDSSCDLPKELTKKHNIHVVPFYVSFDSENYYKEGEELEVRDFYQRMVNQPKVYPKSSLPSVQNYMDAFLPYLEKGIPIICICITSKFSGSYNSASTAKDILLEDYPEASIAVIDSTINTVLQGIYVMEAARMQAADYSFEETLASLEAIKSSGRIFFTIGSIDYLKKGGRIGKLAGLAASTLGIKPLIQLKEGEIFPFGISRSRKKSLDKVIEQVQDHFSKNGDRIEYYSLSVGYGYDYDEAVEMRTALLNAFPSSGLTNEDIPLFQIGATIAVHTGPYPLGIALVRKYNAPALQAAVADAGFLKPAMEMAAETAKKVLHKNKTVANR